MAYKVFVSPRAQREIEHAIDFYSMYSVSAPKQFINSLKNAYAQLGENPYLMVVYKNIRRLKLSRFPYTLFFTVDADKGAVYVLSCFHNKRNPQRLP